MPELPEVETVCRGLDALLPTPCRVTAVDLQCGDLRQKVTAAELQSLEGEELVRIYRRAKYLLFEFRDHVLINHLGMTGSWRLGDPERKHDHCWIRFAAGQRLVFNDPRRFGLLVVVKRGQELAHPMLRALGPEPLSEMFSSDYIFKSTRGRATSIKAWLMDQRRVVGVGNIYACEALFRAHIRPLRRAGTLKQTEAKALAKAVKAVLKVAIAKGGTTFRDFRQAGDRPGDFQDRLLVYDRRAQACRRCRTPIRHQVLVGRSTYWCPKCQL